MERLTINNIWGGEAASQYFAAENQYMPSVGIDPDFPISDSAGDTLPSGAIRPVAYAAFSSTLTNSTPYWILTNPKDTKIYSYLLGGRLVSHSNTFGTETNVGTPTSGAGNGMAYYNNYIYLFTPTNVSRYGPLDGAPTLTNTVWTGSTLGSQTALVNTTYPSAFGTGTLPNHVAHVHTDNKLYFCDFDSTSSTDSTRGKGMIHFIKTTYGAAEGDTNDGSTYNALDLPAGYMPTCIESFGDILAIGAIQTTNGVVQQGKAVLFFWNPDGTQESFDTPIPLPDPLVTAIVNNNGTLYLFSGAFNNGYRLLRYEGGQTVTTLYYSNHGSPPLPGAVSSVGDRIVWGTHGQISSTTPGTPEYYGIVKAYGSKDPNFFGGVHTIINSPAAGTSTDGVVTAVAQLQQASFAKQRFVVGYRDASATAIANMGTTYGTHVWRSRVFNIGQKFQIKRLKLNFGAAVAANMTITPTIFLDDFSSSTTTGLTVINSTNYANSERTVTMYPTAVGTNNFVLELRSTGTALLPVTVPITIDFEFTAD